MVAAVDSFTANTYEEARNQRLEENKRKFQDLGISNISKTLTHLTASPNKSQVEEKSRLVSIFSFSCFDLEPRRSSRQRNPIQSYRDDVDIGLPTLRKRSRKTSSSWGSYLARPIEEVRAASYEERSAAFQAAEKLQENLQTENPTFVKSMVRSHVYSCFWLGLPSKFCEDHLSKMGSEMVLEDEDGNEYDAVYIGKRAGLSGGWRGFALEHKLDDGDALVFELTEPARFKIYIVKAYPMPSLECFKNNVDKEEITSAEKTSKAAMKTDSESNQKRRSKRGIVPEMDESQTSPHPEPNQKRRSKRGTVPAIVDTKTSPDSESIQKRRSERGVVPVMKDSKTSPVLEPNQRRRSKRGMVPEMDDTKTFPDSEPNQKRRSKRGTVPAMVDTKTSQDSESIQKLRSERGVVPVMEDSKTSPVLEPNQRRRSKRGMVPEMDDTKTSPDSESNQKQRSKRGIVPEMDDTKTTPKVLPDSPKGQEIKQEVSPMKKNEVAPKQIRKKAKANRVRSTENPEGCEVQEASTESPEGCEVKQEASTNESVHSSINECSSRTAQSQRSMASQKLGIDTVRNNTMLCLQPDIVSSAELGKAPFPALNDLLTTRELELGTAESLMSMVLVAIFATNREKHLTNINPSASTQGLPKSTSHTSLKPIGSGTRKHFVDPENMEGVNPNSQMKGVLSGELGHVLVAGDTSGLESFARNIFFLPRNEVDAEGKLIHALLLHTHIVDSDLRVRNTTAETGFRVGFVLDLAIAPGWPSSHGD